MCTAALVSKVTWGDPRAGGDSSSVQSNLRFVVQVQATQTAFAALLYDGSVVTWGQQRHGGDSSVVQGELKNVQQIQAWVYARSQVHMGVDQNYGPLLVP